MLLASVAAWTAATGASAAQWSAPIAVPGMKEAFISRVAVAPNGAVAVASASSFAGTVAVRYPNGRWAPVHKLGDSRTLASSPDIAFDARGRLLVVWNTAKHVGKAGFAWASPYTVMAQTWTEAKGWGAARALGPAKNFVLAQPRIAVDARGDAIVAWWGSRGSGGHTVEVVSTSFRPAGGGWQAMQQTSSGGPYRDVALDAHGNAYLVWTTEAGPRNWFSIRARHTGRWSAPAQLPGKPASVPTIAVNPDGAAVMAWRAAIVDSEGEGIQYGTPWAIVRSPSGRWGKPLALSQVQTHEVSLALAPNGTILLSWAPSPNFGPGVKPGQTDVHFSLLSRSLTFSPEQAAPESGAGPIAYRRDGDAILVFGPQPFEGLHPGSQGPIRFAALVPDEPTFSEPVAIVAHGEYPALATPSTSSGSIEAAMSFYQESGKRIELSLLTRGALEPRPRSTGIARFP